jgi:PAS domain S-box-containing protein
MFLQGIAIDITDQKGAEAALVRGREELEEQVQRRTAELAETNRALQEEIEERRRSDLAVLDREARLRSIVESAVDGIILIDMRGNVEAINPAAERIFGCAASEVLGRNISMLMPAPYRESHDEYLDQYLHTRKPKVIGISRDVTGLRRDGMTFPMELSVSETPTGSGTKFTGLVRDVTERKREEAALIEAKLAAESANRLKGEFLANMSHEIRTPMNGIIGMTELALDTELTSNQRECLETVLASTESLLTIVNDILDFSKIEAGKLDLDPIDFSLRATLNEILRPLPIRAHSKRLEVILEVEPEVPDRLTADNGRLRQILLNLLRNALTFTEE